MTDSERLTLAVDLLKRWDMARVPDTVWTEPGEDYLLPTDTQEFLADEDSRS